MGSRIIKFSICCLVLFGFSGCFKGVKSEEGEILQRIFREIKIPENLITENGGSAQLKTIRQLNLDYFKIIDFFQRREISEKNFLNDPYLFRNWLAFNLTLKEIKDLKKENKIRIWYWFIEKNSKVVIKVKPLKANSEIIWERKNKFMTIKNVNAVEKNIEKDIIESIYNGEVNVVNKNGELKWNSKQFFKLALLADILKEQIKSLEQIKYYPSGRVKQLPDIGGPHDSLFLEDKSYIEKIRKSLEIYEDEIIKYKPDGDPQEVHFTYQYVNDMLVAENHNKNISAWESGEVKKLKKELDLQYKKLQEKESWHRIYYEEGSIKLEGNLSKNNKKFGTWKHYYKNGNLEAEGEYKEEGDDRVYDGKGYRVGTWKKYYESGELEALKTYNNVVDVKEYYKNGNLKSIGSYTYFGIHTGEWRTYYENGRLQSTGKYDDQGTIAFKIGTWNYYDSNGKLWYTETR